MASASEHSAWRRLVSQLLRLPVNQFSNTLASDPRIKAKFKTITSKLQLTQITGDDPTIDSDVLKYTWPALKLALTVFEGILDGVPIPGLKGAIGGFLELVKAAEKHVANLTRILKCWSGAKELPPELETRITTFFRDLAEFSQEFHKLTARGTLHCFLSATDDAAKLSGLIRDIDQLVNLPDGIAVIEVTLHVNIQMLYDWTVQWLILVWIANNVRVIHETIKEERSQHTILNFDNPVWSLPRAENARFDASTRQDASGCLELTRTDVLGKIDQWIEDAPWMFVVQGFAGTGKLTIAHTNEASCSNPFLVFMTIVPLVTLSFKILSLQF
ncbi:hypothetical protein PILCRDRAFT_8104 [Piloderma croceum F 1598]|uniref:Fungal STAND N-terminal Goodbye domain-containing protein n=1 Tax=Piloderma croceum (strain F 1598) TaxID=765440 RepID=A0A0C3FRE3_PILCF|nr:hypothetical protein PILCRDRAFT_8104 [Piloderma croceum F 1598]